MNAHAIAGFPDDDPLGSAADPNYDPAAQFHDELLAAYDEIGRFNLWVVGGSGAGKSTLINAVFGDVVAATGAGAPVTPNTTYLEHPSGMFGVFDSRGFEPGQPMTELINGITSDIVGRRDKPIEEQIHVAWFVIDGAHTRFLDQHETLIRHLHELEVPVVLVCSKVELGPDHRPDANVRRLIATIESQVGDVIVDGRVFPVLARQMRGTMPHGLGDLLDATRAVAPEGVRMALDATARLEWERKWDAAQNIVLQSVAAAGLVAAVPLPVPNAAALLPVQIQMLGRISAVYGIPIEATALATMIGEVLLAGGAKFVAQQVLSLTKGVPGVGIIASVVNAGAASAMTSGLGFGWLYLCEFLAKADPETRAMYLSSASALQGLLRSGIAATAVKGSRIA